MLSFLQLAKLQLLCLWQKVGFFFGKFCQQNNGYYTDIYTVSCHFCTHEIQPNTYKNQVAKNTVTVFLLVVKMPLILIICCSYQNISIWPTKTESYYVIKFVCLLHKKIKSFTTQTMHS